MRIRIAVPLLAGLAVLALLAPFSRVDTLPVQCLSVFDYEVSCGAGQSVAAGAASAGVVGLALWLNSRRTKHHS
jgi:hypothetical protein